MGNRRRIASQKPARMQPNMNNGGRWDHIASDAEVMRAMRMGKPEVYEVPMLTMTFLVFRDYLITVRCGALGGDIREIEGGWVYANDIAQRLDEMEIRKLADNPMNEAFGG